MKSAEVAIVGGGPAGIAAAVQLTRYGILPMLFEHQSLGGLIRNAYLVENFPSYPEGVSGAILAEKLASHVIKSGVTVIREKVLHLRYGRGRFKISTERSDYVADFVVVASGTAPVMPAGIALPAEEIGKRIIFEVVPIMCVTGKKVAIIGAGDIAFDYALSLSRHNDVVVLNRSATHKCTDRLYHMALRAERITHIRNAAVRQVTARSERLRINYLCCGKKSCLDVDYVVIAVGRKPNVDFIDSATVQKTQDALAGRLHIIGDARNDKFFRHVVIAMGDGMRAAATIARALTKVKSGR